MSAQLRLPGIDPPRQLQPSQSCANPVVWVKRLRVLRDLKAGDEHVIRDVELRRGLNIVWAPPQSSATGNALFQNGVAGHTAGKSTFCRLIRYALGEHGFAADSTRRRIREKLLTGWVLGEVVVDAKVWIVARPLAIGPHSFCVRANEIAAATDGSERLDYQLFLAAIEAATVNQISVKRFPVSDEPIRWGHLLPWLSRDQECRYADFMEWRHSSSDSEAPSLNADERQFLVRSVLGLISDDERLEQQKNAKLVAQKRNAAEKEPLLRHQAQTDHSRVSAAFGTDFASLATPLFGSQARAELDRKKSEISHRKAEHSNTDRRVELRTALEQAIAAETNAKRNLDDTVLRLISERAVLSQLSGVNQSNLLASLPPPSDYCNVRISVARENACPLAVSRPISLGARRSERTAAEELTVQRQLVASLEAMEAQNRKQLATSEQDTVAARRAFLLANTAFEEKAGLIQREQSDLAQVEKLIDEAERAWNQANEHADVVKRLAGEIEESYERQKELRREHRDAIGKFSATFDYVVRAILGDEVTGRVDTSGRSLSLVVEEHGERESAAIATVKLLAFDLAALCSSAEGRGSFPRFLIHDGPREADMAPDVYARLFLFAHALEKCFSGEPSFQYILTTTTEPPASLTKEPWLRMTLAGAPAAERFLRCDL